jgi:hypothetical protein
VISVPVKAQKFDSEKWSCTQKVLKAEMALQEKHYDLRTEKGVQSFLELMVHLPKGKMRQYHVSQVMTLAGAFEKEKVKTKRRKKVEEPPPSFREIIDLPDWSPFEGGCFIGVTKKKYGRRVHYTLYIDSKGYRALEKAQFVPAETQPRLWFEQRDAVEWDEVFEILVKTYKEYIWFADEEYYYVLAACAMATFFREVFTTYPYCDFYAAELDCGKTTAMKALIWSSFQGFMPLDPTGPVIFRAIDSCRSAIGIDEVDNLLANPDAQSRILGLLNASYQKGLVAYRIAMEEGGMPIAYDPFGLKAFTHVKAIPESITSRSIVFNLIRSPTKLPLLRTSEIFDDARDMMYKLRITAAEEVVGSYEWVNDFVELANRPKDIFVPPLSMAKLVSDEVFSRMYAWAQKYADALQTEQFDEVKRTLVEILMKHSGNVKVKYLAEELSNICHERGMTKPDKQDRPYYFHTRTVLRMLASMGIHKSDVRTDGNVHVMVLDNKVRHWAVAYRLKEPEPEVTIYDALVPEKETPSQDQLITKNGQAGPKIEDKKEEKDGSASIAPERSLSSFTSEQTSKQKETVDRDILTKNGQASPEIEDISLDVHSEDNDENDLSGGTLGISLDSFVEVPRVPVEGQIPNILKSLVKMWNSDETPYRNGVKPKESKDLDLIIKGFEAGYVKEVGLGFWFFTDIAKEEIERWGL